MKWKTGGTDSENSSSTTSLAQPRMRRSALFRIRRHSGFFTRKIRSAIAWRLLPGKIWWYRTTPLVISFAISLIHSATIIIQTSASIQDIHFSLRKILQRRWRNNGQRTGQEPISAHVSILWRHYTIALLRTKVLLLKRWMPTWRVQREMR